MLKDSYQSYFPHTQEKQLPDGFGIVFLVPLGKLITLSTFTLSVSSFWKSMPHGPVGPPHQLCLTKTHAVWAPWSIWLLWWPQSLQRSWFEPEWCTGCPTPRAFACCCGPQHHLMNQHRLQSFTPCKPLTVQQHWELIQHLTYVFM